MKKHSVGRKHGSNQQNNKNQTIAIKPKHAKPYRKRHFGSLLVLVLLGFILFSFTINYRTNLQSSLRSAQDFIAQNFAGKLKNSQSVSSTYGFNFTYNPQEFYVSAIDSATGAIKIGDDLSVDRAYESIQVSPTWVQDDKNQNSMSIEYLKDQTLKDSSNKELEAVETKLVADKSSAPNATLTKGISKTTIIGGVTFLQTEWELTPKDPLASRFVSKTTTYVGVVNDHPMTIKINQGFAENEAIAGLRKIVISMTFGEPKTAAAVQSKEVASNVAKSKSIFDSVLMAQTAEAAENKPTTGSAEYVSALYGPAVVKIYNVFCMDILINNQPYLQGACQGSTGSGFFVSSDGYIATNGHVATSDPKDIVIIDAFQQLAKGNDSYFKLLVKLSGLTDGDLIGAKTEKEAVGIAVDRFYQINNEKFTTTNSVSNLIICLGEDQPDKTEILTLTKNRKEFGEQDSMKRATVVSSDFRSVDGISKFYASDVALLKIEGTNYPTTKLGNISEATQGSGLNIIGFPSGASNNALVESEQSKSTLTTGKVSSVKNATGSDKKLIETDTTIGHGNSGGPVFAESNSVVGIATYTIDGSGKGDGVFNYVRDIGDFKSLADAKNVNLNDPGKTQQEWQKGIDLFYKARYSKSLDYFKRVLQSYPEHPKAAEFIVNAELKIKNGEDVKDFPVIIAIVGAIVIVAGIGVTIYLIIRHNSKHQLYKVASGQAIPMPTGFNGASVNTVSIPSIPTLPQTPATPMVNGGPPAQTYSPQPQQPVMPSQPPTQTPTPPQSAMTPQPPQPQQPPQSI